MRGTGIKDYNLSVMESSEELLRDDAVVKPESKARRLMSKVCFERPDFILNGQAIRPDTFGRTLVSKLSPHGKLQISKG